MRLRYTLLILLMIPIVLFAQRKDDASIYGKVVDNNNNVIELVNIAVMGTSYGTSSNARGQYELHLPSDTTLEVVFSFVGYQQEKRDITLRKGEERKLDVVMQSISTTLPDAIVSDRQIKSASITRLDARKIDMVPSSGAGGVEDLVKTLPGVSSTNELSSQYNVRGGNFDENLIYINGIEVYKPFLVGSGQQEGMSIINPKLVSNIDFSAGGFSAEYGDKLSSALDITYKKPLIPAASLTLSFLGVEAHTEGSALHHRLSYLIGARYKNNKYILGNMETKGSYQPNFTDVQGVMSYNINTKLEISAFGYYSRNSYKMIPETRQTDFGNIQAAHRLTIYFDGKEASNYNVGLGAITLNYSPHEDLNLKLIASTYSAVEAENYDIMGQYWIGQLETNPGSEQSGDVISNQGIGTFIEHARNDFYSQVFNIDHKGAYKKDFYTIKWGARYQHQYFDDVIKEWELIDSAGFSLPHPHDSIGSPNPPVYPFEINNLSKGNNILRINNLDGFIHNEWTFNSANADVMTFSLGLRANYWGYNKKVNISPRAGFAFRPGWNNDMLFRISGGVYVQPPFYRELRMFDGSLISPEEASTQKSYQLVFTHEYNFRAWDRPFVLTTELYYKYLKDIIPYEVDNIRIRYYADQKAQGYATGLDLRLNGEFVKGIESWASLSIMKSEENIRYYISPNGTILSQTDVNNGEIFVSDTLIKGIPRPSDQRLNFSLFFQDYVPFIPSFKVNLKLVFGTGMPFGAPHSERYQQTRRMSAYRRIDIGFSKQLISDKTSFDKNNPLRFIRNSWISLEIFNLLGINNVSSYMWVTDIYNIQYAVPNYLTPRQINLKLVAEF
ncbi:MAG: TonB-dependent receptor [Lentimicrobiaceae bacterium]|nr:TonB-dependent receptor [Lentimicrobiaceae bacterium]